MNTALHTADVIQLHNNDGASMPTDKARMSDRLKWAWSQKTGNSTYKLVLVALVEHANKGLLSWPSIAALEAETELNRKTVMKALAALRAMQLIEDTGERTGTTKQVIVFKLRLDSHAENISIKSANSTNFGTCNNTNLGTVKTVETVPNFPETVPNFPVNSTKNDSKQYQNWYTEPLEPPKEPPKEPPIAKELTLHPALQSAPKSEMAQAKKSESGLNRQVWSAYSQAYENRYHVAPTRNAKINKQIDSLVKNIGADAVQVAAWFVSHSNAYYIQRGHSIGVLLADCEKLRTEWATGRTVSAQTARQLDKTSANAEALAIAQQMIRQRYSKGDVQ